MVEYLDPAKIKPDKVDQVISQLSNPDENDPISIEEEQRLAAYFDAEIKQRDPEVVIFEVAEQIWDLYWQKAESMNDDPQVILQSLESLLEFDVVLRDTLAKQENTLGDLIKSQRGIFFDLAISLGAALDYSKSLMMKSMRVDQRLANDYLAAISEAQKKEYFSKLYTMAATIDPNSTAASERLVIGFQRLEQSFDNIKRLFIYLIAKMMSDQLGELELQHQDVDDWQRVINAAVKRLGELS